MSKHEKSPLHSKKFLAYLLAEATWKLILVITLLTDGDSAALWAFMLAIVLVAGFIEAGFILGQAALDKYVRVARIAAGGDEPPSQNIEP